MRRELRIHRGEAVPRREIPCDLAVLCGVAVQGIRSREVQVEESKRQRQETDERRNLESTPVDPSHQGAARRFIWARINGIAYVTHSVGGSYISASANSGWLGATIAVSKKGTGVRIGHRAALTDRDTGGPTGDPTFSGDRRHPLRATSWARTSSVSAAVTPQLRRAALRRAP